jgi:hypothetical protein
MVSGLGELDGEAGAPAGGAFDSEAGRQVTGDVADDGEAESGGGAVVLDGFLGAVVVVEDARQFVFGDADAVVADGDDGGAGGSVVGVDLDEALIAGVIDGVDDEVFEEHGEVVSDRLEQDGFGAAFDLDVAQSCGGFDAGDDLLQGLVESERALCGGHLALGAEVGELEHFLDLAREGEAAGGDLFHDGAGGVWQWAAEAGLEQLGLGVDGGEGGFELVGGLEHVTGTFLAAGLEAPVGDGEFMIPAAEDAGEAGGEVPDHRPDQEGGEGAGERLGEGVGLGRGGRRGGSNGSIRGRGWRGSRRRRGRRPAGFDWGGRRCRRG